MKISSKNSVLIAGIINAIVINMGQFIPHLNLASGVGALMYILINLILLGTFAIMVLGAKGWVNSCIMTNSSNAHNVCMRVRTSTVYYSGLLGVIIAIQFANTAGGMAYVLSTCVTICMIVISGQLIIRNIRIYKDYEEASRREAESLFSDRYFNTADNSGQA